MRLLVALTGVGVGVLGALVMVQAIQSGSPLITALVHIVIGLCLLNLGFVILRLAPR